MTKKKDQKIVVSGEVLEAYPSAQFKVRIDSGQEVHSHLSGRMRMNYIKIVPGDKVELELSAYDLTKGRITKRL